MSQPLILRHDGDDDGSSKPILSSSVIVAICLVGAVLVCVLVVSITRLCQRTRARLQSGPPAEAPPEHLFRPYAQDQVEHMRQVRWMNHCQMWEVGRRATRQFGQPAGFFNKNAAGRPMLNRRTGIGWGFVMDNHGNLNRANEYASADSDADADADANHVELQPVLRPQHQNQQPWLTHDELDTYYGQAQNHLISTTKLLPRSTLQIPGFEHHHHHHRRKLLPPVSRSVETTVVKNCTATPRIVVSEYGQIFDYEKGEEEKRDDCLSKI